MARGWESKSVEEQIMARDEEALRSAKTVFTPRQRELQSKRDGLQLLRARTLSLIQSARSEEHRHQHERALAHLDAELSGLETAKVL